MILNQNKKNLIWKTVIGGKFWFAQKCANRVQTGFFAFFENVYS